MKKEKQQNALSEITKKRIAELQWKKEVKEPEEKIAAFIVDVLYEEQWIKDRYEKVQDGERTLINRFFEFALNSLAAEDYDNFRGKVQPLLNDATRQNIAEVETVSISNAISKLTKENHRFPARCEIISETGYSHKRVNDCLATYEGSFIQKGRQEEMTLMREKMLSVCYQNGIRGDMKAARLFLDATATQRRTANIHNEQNNFIQVNNLTITEHQLNQLPQDKQQQMKDILTLLRQKADRKEIQ